MVDVEAFVADGYVKIPAPCLPWKSVNHRALALGVVQLMQHGWHPSFLLMYDEAWAVAHELSDIVQAATGGNRLNFDALCWHVDPTDAHPSAFSPHRDRQPDDSPATFRPDGTAMYATAWVPFTDASPENSCLYVIPRPQDPGYFDGDDDDPNVDKDPLQLCLPAKEAYQHITAIPAEAGSAVVFTHRVIHWGSRGVGRPDGFQRRAQKNTLNDSRVNANAQLAPPVEPRVCVSFGFADDAYEPAYLPRAGNVPFPPLAHRAALVSAQSIAYHERFPPSARMLRLMHDAVTNPALEGVLEPKYRKKVMFEYVNAQLAVAAGRNKSKSKNKNTKQASTLTMTMMGGDNSNSLVGRGRKKNLQHQRPTEHDDDGEGRGGKGGKRRGGGEEDVVAREEVDEVNSDDDDGGDSFDDDDDDDDDDDADDAMERALEAMIDAKMDGGGDDFEDDFDDYEDGVLEDEDGVSLLDGAALHGGKKKKRKR